MASLSPFVIEKTLQGCVGTVKMANKLQSGVLLVEVTREAQANKLMKLSTILDLAVKVTPHRSLNSSKGVVRCAELAQLSETELVSEPASQHVIGAKVILTGPGPILPINRSMTNEIPPDRLNLLEPEFSNKEGNEKIYNWRSKTILKWAYLFNSKLATDREVDDFFTCLNEAIKRLRRRCNNARGQTHRRNV